VLAIVPLVVAFLIIQRRFTESIATSGLRLPCRVDKQVHGLLVPAALQTGGGGSGAIPHRSAA
jgi:hypothetical protein